MRCQGRLGPSSMNSAAGAPFVQADGLPRRIGAAGREHLAAWQSNDVKDMVDIVEELACLSVEPTFNVRDEDVAVGTTRGPDSVKQPIDTRSFSGIFAFWACRFQKLIDVWGERRRGPGSE